MTARVDHGALVAGVVFVNVGVAFLLQELEVWTVQLPYLLAVLLIGLGVSLLVDRPPGRASPGGG